MASTKKYLFNLNFLGNQHSDILLDPPPSNLKKILDLPKMLPTLKKLEILVSSFVPSIQFCLIPQIRQNSKMSQISAVEGGMKCNVSVCNPQCLAHGDWHTHFLIWQRELALPHV